MAEIDPSLFEKVPDADLLVGGQRGHVLAARGDGLRENSVVLVSAVEVFHFGEVERFLFLQVVVVAWGDSADLPEGHFVIRAISAAQIGMG